MTTTSRKLRLLSGVSLVALSALGVAPAVAGPVIYDTGTDNLSGGDSNTSATPPDITTTGTETQGAVLTGNGAGTYGWDIDGNIIVGSNDTEGFSDTRSGGTANLDFNGVTVTGNDRAGISITTSGDAITNLDILTGSAISGDASGTNPAGLYVSSTSTGTTNVYIDETSSVTNGGSAAGVIIVQSANDSGFNNSGTISGGPNGHGVWLEGDALIGSFYNQSTGSISGGTSGISHGMLIEAYDLIGAGTGIDNIYNYGLIEGGTAEGNGIAFINNASIGSVNNYNGGTIRGTSATSSGISLSNDANIGSLANSAGGLIRGGTGNANGIILADDSHIGSFSNRGTIQGGDTAGNGVFVFADSSIDSITNYSTGTISGNSTGGGYGILVTGDVAEDTATIGNITNRGTINSGANNAAIGLLGGDDLFDPFRVTTDYITNTSSGVIQGVSGGDGIIVGNYHTLTTLTNTRGLIAGNGANGAGVEVGAHGIITNLYNGTSSAHFAARIAGSDTSTGGKGIDVYNFGTIGTLTNWGYISSRVSADSTTGIGISITNDASITTIENYGTIRGGTTSGHGIYSYTDGTVGTINNYSGATISGDVAILLTGVTTVNTAGTITGDIQLYGTGAGDTLNIYGGTINGDIYGYNSEGGYGTVNFDLVGGTFGIDGVSVDGTFATDGNFGANDYRLEAVNINSGTVTLNDDIVSLGTTIDEGATLEINSSGLTIDSSLINNGTLNLQDSHVTIDIHISGSGTISLAIGATPSGTHGYITNSGGAVDLSNMTISGVYAAGNVVAGETLLIVDTPGTLTYNPARMLSSNGIRWSLSEATSGSTDFHGYSYSAGALLATSYAITSGIAAPNAGALDPLSSYSGSDADILALQNGLDNTTDNNEAGAQLRPDANGGGILGALGASEQAQNNISMHMGSGNGSGISSGDTSRGLGFWMHGFGSFADQGTISGVDGFESNSYGATFGADKEVRTDLRIGAAFTYANTDVDDKGARIGSGENIDSYIGNIYGNYEAARYYISGVLTAGSHDYDTTRLVSFVGPTVAKGEFNSQQYGAKAEIGFPIPVKRVTLTPLAAFAYDTLLQDGYTETGAGGANLVVGDSTVHSYRGTLGVKAAASYDLSDAWKLKPGVYLSFKREFNEDLVPGQDVGFAGGGVSFTTPGLKLPQNAVAFGAALDLLSVRDITLTAKYDGEYRSNYSNNSVRLKGRFEF